MEFQFYKKKKYKFHLILKTDCFFQLSKLYVWFIIKYLFISKKGDIGSKCTPIQNSLKFKMTIFLRKKGLDLN